MKKWILGFGIAVVALVLIVLVGLFFSLNGIVKKSVETVGPMVTKVDVKLGAADISPFSGSGQLTKFVLGNPPNYKSPFSISVGDAKLAVQINTLLSDVITVNEINIQSAELNLEGSLEGNNLKTILDNVNSGNTTTPKPKDAPPTAATSKSSKKFIVKDIVVAGTKLSANLTLPVVGAKSLSLTLPELHLQNIGTADNGVTVEQLIQDIIKPLLASAQDAAVKAAGDIAGQVTSQFKDLGKGTNQVNDTVKGVTDLFKKKP